MTSSPPTPTSTTPTVDDCVRRLEALMQRSSAFVSDQLARLEELAEWESPGTGFDDQAVEAEWRRDQAVWQQQRTLEEARIQEQLDHLEKVWREIEVEQRRLLMQGRQSPEPVAELHSDVPPTQTTPSQHSLDLIESNGTHGTASAAFQFQRLKREIRQQSQRHRQGPGN